MDDQPNQPVPEHPVGPQSGYGETHLSRLFFTPDRVYKLLKSVDTGFVSFTSSQSRLAGIEAEYYLNSRVSPDVYLGVADIVENDSIVDRMLIMKRLPAARQLSRLLEAWSVRTLDHSDPTELQDCVREAARCIAAFHSDQVPVYGSAAAPASLPAIESNWNDNFTNLAPLVGTRSGPGSLVLIDGNDDAELRSLVEQYLHGRAQLLLERQQHGRIIDGHGDLRAEHVFCLEDGVRIIDCVAFRDDYRIVDVLNDVAFLAMDIHRLAGRELATYFVNAYDEFSNEHHPSTLAHFFAAYRAHVRAKVAAIRFRQGDPKAASDVTVYHRLALEHMRAAQVRLVLVGGGAGVGKSTVAEGLAHGLQAIWLRSDEIRKAMGGLKADDHAYAQPDEGLYRPEVSNKVYTEMLRQANELLVRGENVVLDATWSKTRHRTEARAMASSAAAHITELCCHTSLAVAKERIARRAASIYNPSDATVETADYLASNFDPWAQSTEVDTSGSIPEAVDSALTSVFAEPTLCSGPESVGAAAPSAVPGTAPVAVDESQVLGTESITLFFSQRSSLTLAAVLLDRVTETNV